MSVTKDNVSDKGYKSFFGSDASEGFFLLGCDNVSVVNHIPML